MVYTITVFYYEMINTINAIEITLRNEHFIAVLFRDEITEL